MSFRIQETVCSVRVWITRVLIIVPGCETFSKPRHKIACVIYTVRVWHKGSLQHKAKPCILQKHRCIKITLHEYTLKSSKKNPPSVCRKITSFFENIQKIFVQIWEHFSRKWFPRKYFLLFCYHEKKLESSNVHLGKCFLFEKRKAFSIKSQLFSIKFSFFGKY